MNLPPIGDVDDNEEQPSAYSQRRFRRLTPNSRCARQKQGETAYGGNNQPERKGGLAQ